MKPKVAESIKKAREGQGLSVQSLSESSGVPSRTIQDIELGVTKKPGFFNIAKLAESLGISLDEIAGIKVPASDSGPKRLDDRVNEEINRLLSSHEFINAVIQRNDELEALKSRYERAQLQIDALNREKQNLAAVAGRLRDRLRHFVPREEVDQIISGVAPTQTRAKKTR